MTAAAALTGRPLLRTVTFSILPLAEGEEGLQPAALFEMLQLLADPAAAGGPPLLGGYPVAAVPTVPEVEATEAVAAGGEAAEDGPRDIGDGWLGNLASGPAGFVIIIPVACMGASVAHLCF